jgi:hypothetical protein
MEEDILSICNRIKSLLKDRTHLFQRCHKRLKRLWIEFGFKERPKLSESLHRLADFVIAQEYVDLFEPFLGDFCRAGIHDGGR